MTSKQIVLITGAASGIGHEIWLAFLENGDQVVFTDVNTEKVTEVARKLREDGYECLGIGCDVTNEGDIESMIKKTIAHYGRIDTLINNAGLQHVALLEEFPTEKFKQLIQVMLVAPFMTTKHIFPYMKKQQFGRIINIASINGLIDFAGKAPYNSAKHGMIGLTKVTALECAENGVTVNALCPDYVDTPLVRN